MSEAFDGAGKPFRGPSAKAGIVILLGVVVAMFIIWNLASWGMELLNLGPGVRVNMPDVPAH